MGHSEKIKTQHVKNHDRKKSFESFRSFGIS